MQPVEPRSSDDQLLTPREVARIFGVRTATIAVWARQGRLPSQPTPGGHRRYRAAAVHALLKSRDTPIPAEQEQREQDAVRLYEQGWSIRQVADRFGCDYSAIRRILIRRTNLRGQGQ